MGLNRKDAAKRRREIVRLHNEGLTHAAIAARTNCHISTVSLILKNFKKMGESVLCVNTKKKRFFITEAQKEQLKEFLKQGADKFGFADERWLQIRVAELIYEKFGIKYHFEYMNRLLRKLSIYPQNAAPNPVKI